MNKHTGSILSVIICFLALNTASAHDTWLLPKVFRMKPEQRSQLMLTSGMIFPQNNHAIKPERIENAFVLLAGEKTQMAKRNFAPKALEISVMPPNVGVATAFVELAPKVLELTPKLVREYLGEIGASDSLKSVWKNVKAGTTMRWRESYSKHAKTFFFIGKEQEVVRDSSWKMTCGMKLEIVPEAHPGLLRAKGQLPVRVLLDGKPLANFPLGYHRENSKNATLQTTDSEGRTTFNLPKAGRYLLRGTLLQPVQTDSLEWQSNFTTLTVEVRP